MGQWKKIPGYEGHYEVSDGGLVRSISRAIRCKGGVRVSKDKVLKPTLTRWGYLRVELQKNNEKKKWHVHQLVLLAFVGPRPDGMECAHGNGNRVDNALSNLRYATRKDNHADKAAHGTRQSGERNGFHRLTEEDVLRIRSDPRPAKHLVAEYGVSHSAICRARNGASWRHLEIKSERRAA